METEVDDFQIQKTLWSSPAGGSELKELLQQKRSKSWTYMKLKCLRSLLASLPVQWIISRRQQYLQWRTVGGTRVQGDAEAEAVDWKGRLSTSDMRYYNSYVPLLCSLDANFCF